MENKEQWAGEIAQRCKAYLKECPHRMSERLQRAPRSILLAIVNTFNAMESEVNEQSHTIEALRKQVKGELNG